MYKITDEAVKALKDKHGDIFLITVEDKSAVFRKPNRQELSYAMVASHQGNDAVSMCESIANSCYVEGDREIIDNDDYFLGAMPVLTEMIDIKQGEIKKL